MREILIERFIPKKSSLVEYLVFNKNSSELEVKYKSGKHKGKLKKYKSFSREEFDFVVQGESVGKGLLSVLQKRAVDKKNSSLWTKIQDMLTGY